MKLTEIKCRHSATTVCVYIQFIPIIIRYIIIRRHRARVLKMGPKAAYDIIYTPIIYIYI